MGSTLRELARKAAAVLLAACLVAGLTPATGLASAPSEPYGTRVGDMAQTSTPGDHVRTGTDVNIAVKGNLSLETSPALTIFDWPEQLEGDDRFLVSQAKGGVKIKDSEDGLPYTYTWSRQVWDAPTKTFIDEAPNDPYKMSGVVEATLTTDGMQMRYDLTRDAYRMNTLYRYTVSITDAAGNTCENQVEVFCGNEYIYGTITNGKPGNRDAVQTSADLAADEVQEPSAADTDAQAIEVDPTIVDVTAMRLFDSELVVSELGAEMRSMLLTYAEGQVMDSATNVSLVSERATADKPVFITPPMVKLAFRLHDQSIDEGWPVRVLAIQDGRVVTVTDTDATVEVDADGYKVARVGTLGDDGSGVDTLGVFAVTYPPRGGAQDQVLLTSQAGIPAGIDGFGEASTPGGRIAPADTDTLYAAGTLVRYTFLPDDGYAFDFATLGTDPDGAKNPRVTSDTEHAELGANFLDLEVYRPHVADHLYVTAYFKHVRTPPAPVDPDNPDVPTPTDPLKTYTIVAGAATGGAISPSGTFLVRCGEDVTFTVIPDANFAPDSVTVNGYPVALTKHAAGYYTFTMHNVQSNAQVWATFKASPGSQVTEDPLEIEVVSVGPGLAHPAGVTCIARGESLTVTLVPDAGCRLLSLTLDGRDVMAEVAANLTYTIEDVQANKRLQATFSDAAGNTDPVIPERALIETEALFAQQTNSQGVPVAGYIEPYRAQVALGDAWRFTIKPANGSYAASAQLIWTDEAGMLHEEELTMRTLPLPDGVSAPAGSVMKPYSYVDVQAQADRMLLRVIFDACESDPTNPGGDNYVYPDTPLPAMQHTVQIKIAGDMPGGIVTASRNDQALGAAPSYIKVNHDGTVSVCAIPYGGYEAHISVDDVSMLVDGASNQTGVPPIADPGDASGTPLAKTYTVKGDGCITITFTRTGGYTPPVPDPGCSLYHALSIGKGSVAPGFASVAEGAPAATFTVTPDKGYQISSIALYDQTSGADVTDRLGVWDASGAAISLGYAGEHAFVLTVTFAKIGEGAEGPSDPGNTGQDPDAPTCTLTARVGHDMDQYTGEGTVAIRGSDATDSAGNPTVALKAGQTATIEFAPGENSTLAYVTIAFGGGAAREVSVLGSTLTLTATGDDMLVTAYFKYGTFIEHIDLNVTFEQNLTPDECGWKLSGTPTDKVPYGDSLVVSVDPIEGSQKSADYELTSLTVNGVECAPSLSSGTTRSAEYVGGSYIYPNIIEDTHVVATFTYVNHEGPDDPSKPDDPDDPSGPGDPDDPDDPNNPGTPSGPDDPSVAYLTVSASSSGNGTIAPAGDTRVVKGRAISFTLAPDAGFQPVSVTITDSRGTRTVSQRSTQLLMTVSEDTRVVANFATQAYPGATDTLSRAIRHLQSLAKTGDLQPIVAVGLVGIACAAAGVALIVATRRRKREEQASAG